MNSHTNDWFQTALGVPQDSILSPLIFLAYTAEITMEDVLYDCHSSDLRPSEPEEFEYDDDIEFWRV